VEQNHISNEIELQKNCINWP